MAKTKTEPGISLRPRTDVGNTPPITPDDNLARGTSDLDDTIQPRQAPPQHHTQQPTRHAHDKPDQTGDKRTSSKTAPSSQYTPVTDAPPGPKVPPAGP